MTTLVDVKIILSVVLVRYNQTCYILLQLKPWYFQGFVVYYSMVKGDTNMNCQKCEKHSSTITYKNKNYCNWYCAKGDK